jgi:two-component system, OmpR family, response regulator
LAETVLVVEDDDQVRALITTILQRMGHHTIEATNAWQALAALQKPIDLVILDIRMPYDITGGDLIGTLKDLESSVPVVVFSGWTEDLDDELPGFVKAVLSKPVRVEKFVETVNAALGRQASAN